MILLTREPRPVRTMGLIRSLSPICAIISDVGRGKRQREPKATALPWLGDYTDLAAHPLGGALHNREAHPGAFVFTSRMKALKHQEHPTLSFSRNADAIIFKPNLYLAILMLAAHAHAWKASFLHEFHPVAEQIVNALSQRGFVTEYWKNR